MGSGKVDPGFNSPSVTYFVTLSEPLACHESHSIIYKTGLQLHVFRDATVKARRSTHKRLNNVWYNSYSLLSEWKWPGKRASLSQVKQAPLRVTGAPQCKSMGDPSKLLTTQQPTNQFFIDEWNTWSERKEVHVGVFSRDGVGYTGNGMSFGVTQPGLWSSALKEVMLPLSAYFLTYKMGTVIL